MKNITITMEDGLAQQARVAAAKAGKSVSKYLAEAAREKINADEASAGDYGRSRQLEALEKLFKGPKFKISENGRMPTADERNARR